jgi:hypothetical protein
MKTAIGIGNSNGVVTFDMDQFARRLAVLLENKGITTDHELDTAIDALTATQMTAFMKVFLKATIAIKQINRSIP